MTTPLDLDHLEALAAAATPETEGRWRYRRCDFGHGPDPKYSYVEWGKPDEGYGTAALSPDMARYLAVLDPATVSRLVAEIRRLRAEPVDVGRNVGHHAAPVDALAVYRGTCVVCGREIIRLTGPQAFGKAGRKWKHGRKLWAGRP